MSECRVKGCTEPVYCFIGPYAYLCGPHKCERMRIVDGEGVNRSKNWPLWQVGWYLAKLAVEGEITRHPQPDGTSRYSARASQSDSLSLAPAVNHQKGSAA